MNDKILSGRTGRVIATGRALLALIFLLVVWLDPNQPVRAGILGLAILSAYLLWSATLVIIAWRSWWFDFRLAGLNQGIDIGIFLASVYFTESPFSEFQSPFLAFAAFLLITAMVRWGWRGTALTATALLLLNLAFGATLIAFDIQIDLFRFSRRTIYMVLLSIIVIWLSMERRTGRSTPFTEPPGIPGERRELLLEEALRFARRVLNARHAALAYAAAEEPWVDVRTIDYSGFSHVRLGPDAVAEDIAVPRPVALFDVPRQRQLALVDESAVAAVHGPCPLPLADTLGISEGLIAPVNSASGNGQLLVWGIDGICVDDLEWLRSVAHEIGLALDREEMAELARTTAESGIRHAVARDLHDSVAQFLAGTLFRLEALRRWIREGNDPESEIDSIKNALRREQVQLRLLIDRLRRGVEGERRTDLVDELHALLDEIGAHWHIATALHAPPGPLPVSVQLSHELRQLVREAVANAARHGQCRRVDITLARDDVMLKLKIKDDGTGFAPDGTAQRPRSISERVEALGGIVTLTSEQGQGATLEIAINAGDAA